MLEKYNTLSLEEKRTSLGLLFSIKVKIEEMRFRKALVEIELYQGFAGREKYLKLLYSQIERMEMERTTELINKIIVYAIENFKTL